MLTKNSDINVQETCENLRALGFRYRKLLESRKALVNQAEAFFARLLGVYERDLTDDERKTIWAKARKLRELVEAGETPPEEDAKTCAAASVVVSGLLAARGPVEEEEKELKKDMMAIAEELPLDDFVADTQGFTWWSLAKIIGETGDLDNYSGPAKVWKRMGLAPITNHQGETKAGSTWSWGKEGRLTAEEWTEAGYCPFRRSVMYVIGETLVKAGDGYKQIYDARRVHTRETHPEWIKGHSHKDAMRIMVKELLKRLWCRWHGKEVR